MNEKLLKREITEDEISYPSGNPVDPFGRVFFMDNRVLRAVTHEYKFFCEQLLSSSLIEELTEKELIPRTTVIKYNMKGYSLVLEHEKIMHTKPTEWVFSMLKDAGLAILEVNKLCKKHGYCLKDAHPWNISFKNNKPIFLDFGSIVSKDENVENFFLQEFRDTICYPLILWSRNEEMFAQALLSNPLNIYKRTIPENTLAQSNLMKNILTSLELPLESNEAFISSLNLPKSESTMWESYQVEFFDEINKNNFCQRFKRFQVIKNLIDEYSPNQKTIIDLAGNMGAMAFYLQKNGSYEKIINVDYDESAIEVSYRKLRELNSSVETYLLNFMLPKRDDVSTSLKSDISLSLAITHHLILSQGFSLDFIFSRINEYTDKFVYIEFMPLGLWGGGEELPDIPIWYTEEWFREGFVKKFDLVRREQLEKNRIIYIGKIKNK